MAGLIGSSSGPRKQAREGPSPGAEPIGLDHDFAFVFHTVFGCNRRGPPPGRLMLTGAICRQTSFRHNTTYNYIGRERHARGETCGLGYWVGAPERRPPCLFVLR